MLVYLGLSFGAIHFSVSPAWEYIYTWLPATGKRRGRGARGCRLALISLFSVPPSSLPLLGLMMHADPASTQRLNFCSGGCMHTHMEALTVPPAEPGASSG